MTLAYISSKVSAGMDQVLEIIYSNYYWTVQCNEYLNLLVQMKEDIAKELSITDHLTKLSSKVGMLLQRYSELEEGLIEV